jgi:HAD superfamily phosphatase (TIGR01668 family)
MKPAPIAVNIALAQTGVPREQTVIVGDQLFTDIVAGNLAGVRTILVRPQSREDLWYTQIFRKVENVFLRGVSFEGE